MRNRLHNGEMKLFEDIGKVALGTRVRFLADLITADAAKIYSLYGVDLVPKWFPVFYVLSKSEGETITSIAEAIGHSHASVSKIVSEMIKARVVVEKKEKGDQRRTVVALSRKGKQILSKIEPQYLDVNKALDEISAEASHDLWAALEEWEGLLKTRSLLERVAGKKQFREHGVQIIPYQDQYQKDFRDLNEDWIKTYFKMEKPDYDALDHPRDYILNRGGHIFVALLDGAPVGVCALLKREDKHYPYELAKMAVSSKARGKNIGFLLGQAAIGKTRELGAEKLFLESNTILRPAIGLYKKLGFEEVRGLKTPYERCNIQMELVLTRD